MRRRLDILNAALLAVLLSAATATGETMEFSCSAQVAETFGEPLMQTFIDQSGISVHTHISSSNLAISRLLNGFSQVAGSARPLRKHEIESGLIEIPICKDPMAIIVHGDSPAESLTGDQVRRIFNGEIDNWKTICGRDLAITVIVPDKDMAAFDNFQRAAMRMNGIRYDFMTWKPTAAVEAVRYFPGAISFIEQVAVYDEPGIKILAIDGRAVTDTGYPYVQTFSLVTRGKPNPKARHLIDFSFSDTVTDFIVSHRMIPAIN